VSIFKLLTKYKGSISAIGGDGITKAPYISYKYNDTVISIFKEIKKAWDPLGILNPGKKIGTSFSYLQKHIIKDR
jgi:FAD/FMN-containing dehydrogenase